MIRSSDERLIQMIDRQEFGRKLKEIRSENGDRQKDTAEKMGVTIRTIENWENGNTLMREKHMVKFCRMYQVSADYLLGISNDKQIQRHLVVHTPELYTKLLQQQI